MKKLLIILISIIAGTLYSQGLPGEHYELKSTDFFYIYENDTIQGKYTDTNIINGEFTQFKRLIFEGYNDNRMIIPGKPRIHKKIKLYKLVKGQFKDGRRDGRWIIRNSPDNPYSWETMIWEHDVIYKQDTVFVNEFRKNIYYVNDSALVYGSIYHPDTEIEFRCEKHNVCRYWVGLSKYRIAESDYEDLDWYISLIQMGEFDEKIKRIISGKGK